MGGAAGGVNDRGSRTGDVRRGFPRFALAGFAARDQLLPALFHRHALRQISRLIHVLAHENRDMIGEKLRRHGIDQRGEGARRELRHFDEAGQFRAGGDAGAFRADQDQMAAARRDFLQIGDGFFQTRVMRRQHDHRHGEIDQRDRAVLQFAGGVALGVDIGQLLEL